MRRKDRLELEQAEAAFADRLAETTSLMADQSPADIIAVRKTEIKRLLEMGISWRRLAYLIQVPVMTCRRAILADPDLAQSKHPEGWGAEIALATQYEALAAAGFPAAETTAWIKARASYDTSRAKNAYYRRDARTAIAQETAGAHRDIVNHICGARPTNNDYLGIDTPAQQAYDKHRIIATAAIDSTMIVDYDGET